MAKPQLEMVVDDPERARLEEKLAIADERELRNDLFAAIKRYALEIGYDACAAELDKRWGADSIGRHVSGSALRACLGGENVSGTERNYFRLEWVLWFAAKSERVADVLLEIAGGKRGAKPLDEEHEDLHAELRRRYPHDADSIIRKSKLPRRR